MSSVSEYVEFVLKRIYIKSLDMLFSERQGIENSETEKELLKRFFTLVQEQEALR